MSGIEGIEGWTPMDLRMELEPGAWAETVGPEGVLHNGQIKIIGVAPNATNRGRPAVGLLIEITDGPLKGQFVGAWTTYNLFASGAGAFRARYGDPV